MGIKCILKQNREDILLKQKMERIMKDRVGQVEKRFSEEYDFDLFVNRFFDVA
jgi:hypothetical protein